MTRLLIDGANKVSCELEITGDELHYLTRVRRHGEGDVVEVRGAKGRRFLSRITRIDKKMAILILEEELPEIQTIWPVNLIVAVPKRNLMDDIVRKVSEIGVERLLPVYTERSVARPSQARVDRWKKIAKESLRQCGRETPLRVHEVGSFDASLSMFRGNGTTLILHTGTSNTWELSVKKRQSATPPLTVVIGPEGGFSDAEIGMATQYGFGSVGLGSSIMRVETAAIAAAVLCVALLGGYG